MTDSRSSHRGPPFVMGLRSRTPASGRACSARERRASTGRGHRIPFNLFVALAPGALLVASAGLASPAVLAGSRAFALTAAEERPVVTFAGFHVFDDGSSRIFVKLTGKVPVEEKRGKEGVEYVLVGARIGAKNNKNPLPTEYFSASVLSVRLAADGDDVVLTLVLKKGVTPSHKVVQHADGTMTLNVDLPRLPE